MYLIMHYRYYELQCTADWRSEQLRTCVPEAGIKGRHTLLHSTYIAEGNYLCLPWYLLLTRSSIEHYVLHSLRHLHRDCSKIRWCNDHRCTRSSWSLASRVGSKRCHWSTTLGYQHPECTHRRDHSFLRCEIPQDITFISYSQWDVQTLTLQFWWHFNRCLHQKLSK